VTQPNVILVTLHDLGRHLDLYDPDLPATPSIDRIAGQGVTLRQHYGTCPLCSPSRSSICTGRYPHENGMNGLTHRGFRLNDDEKVIADYFNEADYHTALCGFQHEAAHDEAARLHFRETMGAGGKEHFHLVAPRVVQFLQRRHERPFFLQVGTTEVHRKFKHDWNTPISPGRVKVPPYLKDCAEVREDLADFYGLVQVADAGMKPILDTLEGSVLEENTILIFTTDHGFAFPRAKSTLYDPGIAVTFLMQWPARLRPGGSLDALTSHVDVLPTLLEAIGRPIPDRISGRSFLPLLAGGDGPRRGEIFAEKSWHGNEYDPMRCVRTERFKLIRNFAEGWLYQTPLDIKRSLSGKAMEAQRQQPRPMTELYDLENDRDECRNLSGKPDYQTIEQDLTARLTAWMRDTGDPLPDKHIPWPQPDREHFLNNMDCPMPSSLE